jgi:PAS domain S-box-containing protein
MSQAIFKDHILRKPLFRSPPDEDEAFKNHSIMNRQNSTLLSNTRFWQYFAVPGLVTVAYFWTAQLVFFSLRLRIEASPVWPSAGIALAALLLQGQRVWPGVTLGAFLFAQSLGVSWVVACGAAFGSTLQAIVGAELLRRMGFRPSLERLKDVLLLVVFGVCGSTLVGATINTLVAYLGGLIDSYNWRENWWTLWLGDSIGILVITPLVSITHDSIGQLRAPTLHWRKLAKRDNLLKLRRWLFIPNLTAPTSLIKGDIRRKIPHRAEAAICFTLLCAISWFVFWSKTENGIAQYPLEYLPFTFVVWAALRFAQRGALIATLVVSIIGIWGTVQGSGPFIAKAGSIDQAIRFLQCFMGVVTLTGLVLAAVESERALAEDLLKEREASLANAQRLAQLGNWDFIPICAGTSSIPQQKLRWSDELYRLFGFSNQAFEPSWETFFQVVHPDDRERVGQAIRGALRENKPYSLDYRIVLPDGRERVVCEQSELYKGGISGTVQDVTDRKQVEAQLRAAAEHVSEAAARERLLGEMALRIRRSLNIDHILNTTVAEVRQFLGADRVFIGQINRTQTDLNTALQGLVIAESVDPVYPSLQSLVVDDELSLEEWRSLFEQSRVRVIEDTQKIDLSPKLATYYAQYQVRAILGVPILVGDELYGALVINQCTQPRHWQVWEIEWLTSLATQVAIAIQQAELYRQITELNTHLESQVEERTQELSAKMTELQELNQLKDVYLQAVSHDLRTCLLGMSMVLNNLSKSSGEVTLSRPLLERMITSSDRQLNLINSLLEDHFNEERDLELRCKPEQLDELIQNTIAECSSMLTQNKANLTQILPPDLPSIAVDSTQLQQALKNLLINALKHNPPGLNLTLQVTVEQQVIRFILQDDGVGMNQQQQKSLFKLYIRGLHTQHLTGIGLGLYQCRQIINAHGGEIGVISAPGAGSTFWFTLPRAASALHECDRFVASDG